MIPKFKAYLEESVWGDMRRKSLGIEKRIEDDIDLMDPITFCDYIKNKYKLVSTQGLEIFVFGKTEINVPIFEYDLGTKSTDFIYYDSENKRVFSNDTFVYYDDKLLEKLKNTYKVKNFKMDFGDYMSISPKDGSESTNTFFLEVIDYLLGNANVFYHRILIPNDDVNESVWGDLRKKSLGQEIRNENIVDFNSLNGGTMDDLYNYIIQNYEYVQKPVSEYRSIRQLSSKNISIPITLDGGMMETTTDYSNPDEIEFIIIRNNLVKYLDDEAYARYYDYVEKDNPDDEVTKIIVDGDYFPKKNVIGILDALLENVPNPALRKKEIKESVWGDIRKKSLGQEERKETSIDEYSIDSFFKYLKNTYDTVNEADLKTGILNSGNKYIDATIFVQGQNHINLFYNEGIEDEIYFNIMKPEKFEPLVISRITAFISIIKDVFVVRNTNSSDKQQEGYGIKSSKEYPKGRNTLYRKVLNMAIIAFSPKTKKDSYMAIKPKDPNILNESVWGDIRKKSLGKEKRMENDIDGLGFHEFVSYLKDTYTINDPTNFFEIGTFPTYGTDIVNISVPIESKDIYAENKNGPRALTIGKDQKTDEFVNIRPNKYIFKLYPREMNEVFGDKFEVDHTNFELKPKDGVITNTLCVEVIDKLLGMVERPIMTKNE